MSVLFRFPDVRGGAKGNEQSCDLVEIFDLQRFEFSSYGAPTVIIYRIVEFVLFYCIIFLLFSNARNPHRKSFICISSPMITELGVIRVCYLGQIEIPNKSRNMRKPRIIG